MNQKFSVNRLGSLTIVIVLLGCARTSPVGDVWDLDLAREIFEYSKPHPLMDQRVVSKVVIASQKFATALETVRATESPNFSLVIDAGMTLANVVASVQKENGWGDFSDLDLLFGYYSFSQIQRDNRLFEAVAPALLELANFVWTHSRAGGEVFCYFVWSGALPFRSHACLRSQFENRSLSIKTGLQRVIWENQSVLSQYSTNSRLSTTEVKGMRLAQQCLLLLEEGKEDSDWTSVTPLEGWGAPNLLAFRAYQDFGQSR